MMMTMATAVTAAAILAADAAAAAGATRKFFEMEKREERIMADAAADAVFDTDFAA